MDIDTTSLHSLSDADIEAMYDAMYEDDAALSDSDFDAIYHEYHRRRRVSWTPTEADLTAAIAAGDSELVARIQQYQAADLVLRDSKSIGDFVDA